MCYEIIHKNKTQISSTFVVADSPEEAFITFLDVNKTSQILDVKKSNLEVVVAK